MILLTQVFTGGVFLVWWVRPSRPSRVAHVRFTPEPVCVRLVAA